MLFIDTTFDLTATLVPTHRGRLCLDRCVIGGDEDVPVPFPHQKILFLKGKLPPSAQ